MVTQVACSASSEFNLYLVPLTTMWANLEKFETRRLESLFLMGAACKNERSKIEYKGSS
jgi:hypothetical protein